VPAVPLKIGTGLGDKIDILRIEIPYDYGFVHLVSDWFTIPISVSASLQGKGLTGFQSLLTSANLSTSLDARKSVTIFAPSNEALAAAGTPSSLTSTANAHIIPNFSGYLPRLKNGDKYTTIAGGALAISVRDGKHYVNDAQIISADIVTDNGVIHIIDKVLSTGPALSNSSEGWSLKVGMTLVITLATLSAGVLRYGF